ncbi:MAG: hypothetical protein VKO21_11520 [Candidatus Sericytochromatia bacterium]|nr:hypothetical protein [Candidatus Sericytochromatia bacterium]
MSTPPLRNLARFARPFAPVLFGLALLLRALPAEATRPSPAAPILLDRLELADEGEAVRVAALVARIPLRTLGALLAAGAPALGNIGLTPSGPGGMDVRATAVGLPLLVRCRLGAEGGRLLLAFRDVKVSVMPVSGAWLRDWLVRAADPALLARDLWRKRGPDGLSIDPSYLLSWALADRITPSGRHVEGHDLRVRLGGLVVSDGYLRIRVP